MSLTVAYQDPGIEDTHTATVDWGDGVIDNRSLTAGMSSFDITHIYLAPGDFTVSVTLIDKDGGQDLIYFQVNIWLPSQHFFMPLIFH